MTELLLEAHDLVAGYLPGIDILNGCNLEVAEGEIVGVIGPNGAGKSTLVKAMFGLVGVRSGQVRLRGQDFDRVKEINGAGVSVVMVEQNARRCLQICDRAYVLDQGRNAHTGTGDDLLNDAKVVELYLGTLAKAR